MSVRSRCTPLIVLVASIVGVLTPVTAHGEHRSHATTDPVALAVRLAERYWQAIPCHGAFSVIGSATQPRQLDAGPATSELTHNGLALGWTELTATNLADPSTYSQCHVFFNLAFWRDWRTEDGNFQWFCDTMTHELGHLMGHQDDEQSDPNIIEYPLLGPDTPNYDSVQQCRHVTLWYGGARILGR